ncbi:MAG: hypothetical protein C4288_00420 [Leptolyngbya sp. ERB_1_1]
MRFRWIQYSEVSRFYKHSRLYKFLQMNLKTTQLVSRFRWSRGLSDRTPTRRSRTIAIAAFSRTTSIDRD